MRLAHLQKIGLLYKKDGNALGKLHFLTDFLLNKLSTAKLIFILVVGEKNTVGNTCNSIRKMKILADLKVGYKLAIKLHKQLQDEKV